MPAREKDQLGMDETTVNDPAIEAALEERQKRKASLDAVRLKFDEADERAKALVSGLELVEGAVRVGRFRITRTITPARTVDSFETKASSRLRISVVEEA